MLCNLYLCISFGPKIVQEFVFLFKNDFLLPVSYFRFFGLTLIASSWFLRHLLAINDDMRHAFCQIGYDFKMDHDFQTTSCLPPVYKNDFIDELEFSVIHATMELLNLWSQVNWKLGSNKVRPRILADKMVRIFSRVE